MENLFTPREFTRKDDKFRDNGMQNLNKALTGFCKLNRAAISPELQK